MTVYMEQSLLDETDGVPVLTENADGTAPFLIVCDHASNKIPASLGTLGVNEAALQSHAAWDLGAFGIAVKLAHLLDAPLIYTGFSRLVYDVNRPPDSPEAIREASEIYDIPGNHGLSDAERKARIWTIYQPFHAKIDEIIDAREAGSQETVLIALHSFTPVYHGQQRDVQLGVLHDRDRRLADAVLDCAPRFTSLITQRNSPYGPEDGVTHTLARHALPRRLLNVMLEVRNDLISSEENQSVVVEMLSKLMNSALERVNAGNIKSLEPGVGYAPSD